MIKDLIPGFGSAPVPLPVPIVVFLLVLTFAIHIFLALGVVGTIALGLLERLRGRREEARIITAPNMVMISLAITTGIAPLLFVQVLYGPLFYTATILLAWLWFSLIWVMIASYYAFYAHRSKGSLWTLALAVIGFLFVLGLQVAVAIKWQWPESWLAGILSVGHWLPRLLHALVGSLVVGGALAVAVAQYKMSRGTAEAEALERVARTGRLWTLVAIPLQAAIGLWFLLSLGPAGSLFLGGHPLGTGMLILAIILVLAGFLAMALARDPLRSRLPWVSLVALALNVVPMAVIRHMVRDWSLARVGYNPGSLPVQSQWGPFLVFGVMLVAALVLVLYGAWRAHAETKAQTAG